MIEVKRQQGSKQWGVYVNGRLVEGGFFERDAAREVAEEIARDTGSGSVDSGRAAERRQMGLVDF